jgi:hypothetical protein
MATYFQIIEYVKNKYGYSLKTCWIADVKAQMGLTTRQAHNRLDKNQRTNPCPANKIAHIKEAINVIL